MSKDLTVTPQNALAILEQQDTPEAKAIVDYVQAVRRKDIAVLGTDEAFILRDKEGQIKAFKKALILTENNGGLVKPGFGKDMPHVISAQGYEMWAESTGASVIFPKEVLVNGKMQLNPYAERDPNNRRILAVHARAIAFRYSDMGIPVVSDWTTIFDTPSYRMIDLLSKAKQYPQAFKVLPIEMKPEISEAKEGENKQNETWAHYPFDESMNLWINTSHDEVIKWLSQILNREKKAMDFAQTFAKRNALKHLSGLQKAPAENWRIPVLAWRPTGNNIVKWDAAQYADLQDRVAGMIEGGTDDFKGELEINQGTERTSEDEHIEALEAEVDPEDSQESGEKTPEQEKPSEGQKGKPAELSKDIRQAVFLSKNYPDEFKQAMDSLDLTCIPEKLGPNAAVKVCEKIGELVDAQN